MLSQQLESWHEFYILIGTAGVTLTGLLFVVASLAPRVVAEQHATGVRTFASPNAVYFTTTLVVSAVGLFPGLTSTVVAVFLGAGSIGSLGYLMKANIHQRWRQNGYPLVDWFWYVGLPVAAYVLLLVAGVCILSNAALSLYGMGVALILLLLIGIRNAWDIVIWAIQQERNSRQSVDAAPPVRSPPQNGRDPASCSRIRSTRVN
jgi:hypothetical protein